MSRIVSGRLVPIKDIIVGNRRREDMGDIQGLADSINKYGLLHPIVVDDEWNLVAGGRRLEAVKYLGWDAVEVRFATELTEKEKQALELEENIRRKDLTEYEKSKTLLDLVGVVKEQAENEFRPPGGHKYKAPPGRPTVPGSIRDISDRIGVPRSTISEAEKHVEAVEKYPELIDLPKKEAIRKAKELNNHVAPKPEPQQESQKEEQPQDNSFKTIMIFYDVLYRFCDQIKYYKLVPKIDEALEITEVLPEPYAEELENIKNYFSELVSKMEILIKRRG